jgi:hypothetical protein
MKPRAFGVAVGFASDFAFDFAVVAAAFRRAPLTLVLNM